MINKLKPYAEYTHTGVQWLGAIPTRWRKVAGRACFSVKHQSNVGMKEKTVLSLSYGNIVVKPEDRLHGLVPRSFETYQVIELGDIVIRPTDLQNDWSSLRFGYAKVRGIITSAYLAFRTSSEVAPRYGYSLLHSYDLMKVF